MWHLIIILITWSDQQDLCVSQTEVQCSPVKQLSSTANRIPLARVSGTILEKGELNSDERFYLLVWLQSAHQPSEAPLTCKHWFVVSLHSSSSLLPTQHSRGSTCPEATTKRGRSSGPRLSWMAAVPIMRTAHWWRRHRGAAALAGRRDGGGRRQSAAHAALRARKGEACRMRRRDRRSRSLTEGAEDRRGSMLMNGSHTRVEEVSRTGDSDRRLG